MEMTEAERATLRVALTRLRHDLEKPSTLGADRQGEALRVAHVRNASALLKRLPTVECVDG